MDTKFWGPSGWRLLHLITFTYTPSRKEAVRTLFEHLPYVLPCKFCRASLQEYMDEDPVEKVLGSKASLTKWLWRIHNKVNEKLRGQHLLDTPDPSFESIKTIYEKRVKNGPGDFEGWDFLFSISENHPYCRASKHSVPMKDCPEPIPLHASLADRNKWNVLTCEERMIKFKKFWISLEGSLPFEEWRAAWKGCNLAYSMLEGRVEWLKELWRFRCCIEEDEDDTFHGMCKKLADHRSGCSHKRNAKTCRKKK
jgi:hypothetical protein